MGRAEATLVFSGIGADISSWGASDGWRPWLARAGSSDDGCPGFPTRQTQIRKSRWPPPDPQLLVVPYGGIGTYVRLGPSINGTAQTAEPRRDHEAAEEAGIGAVGVLAQWAFVTHVRDDRLTDILVVADGRWPVVRRAVPRMGSDARGSSNRKLRGCGRHASKVDTPCRRVFNCEIGPRVFGAGGNVRWIELGAVTP